MPSVFASWNGRLEDRATQIRLCDQLLQLGELSESYFETPEPVRQYDRVIEGNILVSRDLLGNDSADGLLRLQEVKESSLAGLGIEIRPAGPRCEPKSVRDDLYAIERAAIHGIDFRLYDGRHLYPGEDRISFVFFEAEACPQASGAIVQVDDNRQCGAYASELIQGADWLIQRPQIHLRGYCEEWLDMLLGWVKYFYVPSLDFWRWEQLPNWENLLGMYEKYKSGYESTEQYSSVAFAHLNNAFMKNVEEWREAAAPVREFWAHVSRLREQAEGK